MDVMDGSYQFLEVLAGMLFLETGVLNDDVEQLASLSELHNQIEVFFCLDDLVKLHYIRMMGLLQDFYFSRDAFNILLIFYLSLL